VVAKWRERQAMVNEMGGIFADEYAAESKLKQQADKEKEKDASSRGKRRATMRRSISRRRTANQTCVRFAACTAVIPSVVSLAAWHPSLHGIPRGIVSFSLAMGGLVDSTRVSPAERGMAWHTPPFAMGCGLSSCSASGKRRGSVNLLELERAQLKSAPAGGQQQASGWATLRSES
jgi:hypothetical protein